MIQETLWIQLRNMVMLTLVILGGGRLIQGKNGMKIHEIVVLP